MIPLSRDIIFAEENGVSNENDDENENFFLYHINYAVGGIVRSEHHNKRAYAMVPIELIIKNEMADTGVRGLLYMVSAISSLSIIALSLIGGEWQMGN